MPCAARDRSNGNGGFWEYVRSFREDAGGGDGKSCGLGSGSPVVGRAEAPDSHGGWGSRSRWGVVETTIMRSIRPAFADRRSGARKPAANRSEWGDLLFGRPPRRGDNHG